jgi:thioredoxin reductase
MSKPDVLIVGSGPAGLHAAIELQRRLGLTTIVLEREPEPGGVPRWCHHHTYPCRVKKRLFTGPDYAKVWIDEARSASVPILTETTVLRLDAQKPAVQTTSPTGLEEYGARAVLLATGAREAHRHARLVAGDRARGVYTTASLFQSLYGNGHLPERRFVVFGSEDVSYSCVNAIRSQRRTVVAVVETAPATRSFGWLRWFVENVQGVAHFFSVQEFAVHGRPSVSNVSFTTSGSPIPQRLECDGVIFTGGFTPNSELIRAAEVRFNSATHGPSINQSFQTSKPWLFAAGNCLRGVVSGDEAALEGRMAARAIAEFLQSDSKANAPETLLSVDEPLAYCCPDRISADHHGLKRIAIWPNVHARQAELAAWCGNRQLWSKHFRWVQPGRRIFIPVDQLTFSTPPEPIRFSLEL